MGMSGACAEQLLHHHSLTFGCMTSRVLQGNETVDRSATLQDCAQAMALNKHICKEFIKRFLAEIKKM